jgi:hypothetical protein
MICYIYNMIYLVITACLKPKVGIDDDEHRKRTYIESITNTLKVLPEGIKPIIVENNGPRRGRQGGHRTSTHQRCVSLCVALVAFVLRF